MPSDESLPKKDTKFNPLRLDNDFFKTSFFINLPPRK